MHPIAYIQKTRDYYRRKGVETAYRYAENPTAPWTPLPRPLEALRLMLVSSAGIAVLPEGGPAPQPFRGRNIGEKGVAEVFAIPSDLPASRLRYVTGSHNHQESDMHDIDAFFPITRLRELRDEGRIGGLTAQHLRMRPRYSQRETRELDAPEVLAPARALGAEAVLLVPV